MIKGVTDAHLGPISYQSKPSDVPYSPNQFLDLDFFCRFLQQTGSTNLLFFLYDGIGMFLATKEASKWSMI